MENSNSPSICYELPPSLSMFAYSSIRVRRCTRRYSEAIGVMNARLTCIKQVYALLHSSHQLRQSLSFRLHSRLPLNQCAVDHLYALPPPYHYQLLKTSLTSLETSECELNGSVPLRTTHLCGLCVLGMSIRACRSPLGTSTESSVMRISNKELYERNWASSYLSGTKVSVAILDSLRQC